VLQAAADGPLRYVTYSYKERADEYHLPLTPDLLQRLREQSGLLLYSGLAGQIAGSQTEYLALFVARKGTPR